MHSAAKQLSLFSVSGEPDALSGFSVRESSRARRLSIKVYPRGRVEVVVPKRTRSRDVQAFVAENQAWIRKTRAAFAAKHAPEPFRLPVRINLRAIERIFGVVYQPREGGHPEPVRQDRRRSAMCCCFEALARRDGQGVF